MPEKSTGKKNGAGTTLDLMGDEEAAKPKPARKPAAQAQAAEAAPSETNTGDGGGALFGGDEVDLDARHPADVPVVGYPAPSQIAQVSGAADPFADDDGGGEEDPFEDTVMARMLADEPAPLLSPLRAARENMNEAVSAPAGPDLDAFADPVAVPEVEQVVDFEEPALQEEMETPMPAAIAEAPAVQPEAKAVPAQNAAPGLTFTRRYTKPGQNVWDTTEWELRNAAITGSDGTVVFEQNGVEIPKSWSQLATNVVVSKYFRGQIGTLEREYSVKQLIGRVADKILEWGQRGAYFATDGDAEVFHDELRYILLHQFAAFNSPVWFNLGWAGRRQAVSACYITEVDDSMESILDLYKTEGMLFKDGSGSGHNLSPLRSSKEPLSAGGRSSGPIAFMKGLDASAGSIKSGGSTRRAAKMVILNADHPDIQEFIDCKKDAELKAHALIDAGYSGAFNVHGGAYDTVPFQNANHSVRVTDAFMQAVETDGPWETKFRTDGKTAETLRAKDLLHSIAEGTWVCGDPGMQYDTTANDWHTCANTDRIHASNPCVTGDTLVATADGWQRIDSLVGQSARIIGADGLPHFVSQIFPTGHKPVFKLRTRAGFEVTITGNHQVLTTERGDVAVDDLRLGDHLHLEGAGFGRRALSETLALAIGVAVGDGCLSRQTLPTREQEYVILTMAAEEAPILDKIAAELNHQKAILRAAGIAGHPGAAAVVPQSVSGTSRLSVGSACVVDLFKEFAVLSEGSSRKSFTPVVYDLDKPALAAVLRGLFTADGTVANYGDKSQYVALDSTSQKLLQQVQVLLLSFGIKAKLYTERRGGATEAMLPDTNRELKSYAVQETHSLRISKASRVIFEREIGFDPASAKAARLRDMNLAFTTYKDTLTDEVVSITAAGTADVYDLTEAVTSHFVANGLVVHNCSEFFFLNSTACNLSSLNLMKFRDARSGAFDTESFEHAVKVMITAQEIVVGFAHYPTEKIEERSHRFRPLGLGYANLGALLMADGLPYDSDAGRAYAGAVTALMTGRAYHQSAVVARDCGGAFEGFAENREPMLRVMGKHRAAVDDIAGALIPKSLLDAARTAWDDALDEGQVSGYRNAQATVLAPTGCLVAGSLVITNKGVVRLGRLGDVNGAQWQDVTFDVLTDTGRQSATKFYVNGLDQTRRIETHCGYAIQGTPKHRIKVVNAQTGQWDWKRFGEIVAGDVVALSLGQRLGDPQTVTLPPLGEEYWTGDYTTRVPKTMTPELAEIVGYFMGDGSLHAKGPRFCVANTDLDVAGRVQALVKLLFNLDAHLTPQQGYCEVGVHSVPLALWWDTCGFSKLSPGVGHAGKGYLPRIPDAVLATNDPAVYGAFLRGLYEADGTVTGGVPCWSTVHRPFSEEVKTLLLALGIPTSTKQDTTGWSQSPLWVLRLRNTSYASKFTEAVGFMSARKASLISRSDGEQAARHDCIYLAPEVLAALVPKNSPLFNAVTLSQKRHNGAITRRAAESLYAATRDERVAHALRFFYDVVTANDDGGEQLTYDLSVPVNVTYIAQGFVSHNTIGFLMDCDTTGIEPDIAIVKYKSLVGGGMMKIVNQTVPEALQRLGYDEAAAAGIIRFIDEHDTIEGAPGLQPEHLAIFDCAFRPMNGTRSIHYRGHLKMMAAAQPFISGAISKCVTGDTLLATAQGLIRIGSLYQSEKPDTFRPAEVLLASTGGLRTTDAFYYGGGRPTLGVTLRSGHRVTGTPNHRLLVARSGRLDWVRLDEIEAGDAVATQYGTDLWAQEAPRLPVPAAPFDGREKRVSLPETMTEELAWLLGAYAAEGHTTRSTWTVTLTNSVDAVLERAVRAWRSEFGVEAFIERVPGKCPGVKIASKRIVLLLQALGCGRRASEKRIPEAILQSPKPMVLSFLSGLFLDGYAVPEGTLPRMAICLDAPGLLDDLQAILTNLGLVHSRISKKNRVYDKTYDEVYLTGEWAQQLARQVPFMEPDKAASAARLMARTFAQSTADVVPGITPAELLALIPPGRSGRNGRGTSRGEFNFLADLRTKQVSRRTLERVAAYPGVVLPEWLQLVLRDNLRFSPVAEVKETGVQMVYDVSVPVTHAFVGNGIVNHNTVNMPNDATPDEIAQTYLEAWKLGIKAVAIYRDGSKRTQPLNMQSEKAAAKAAAAEAVAPEAAPANALPTNTLAVPKAVRRRLPDERDGVTHKFSIGGHEGYLTVGLYPDTRQPGEIFIRMSKEGSSISGLMDSFATAISLALQYGVPLSTLVDKFIHSRFEPSGFTGNKEIPMAKSVMDYIFRYLALRFLQKEDRHNVGLLADQPADGEAYAAPPKLSAPGARLKKRDAEQWERDREKRQWERPPPAAMPTWPKPTRRPWPTTSTKSTALSPTPRRVPNAARSLSAMEPATAASPVAPA